MTAKDSTADQAIGNDDSGYLFTSLTPALRPASRRISCGALGRRHGKLLIVCDLGVDRHGQRWVGCLCDCGARVARRFAHLNLGTSKSCGCLRRNPRERVRLTDAYLALDKLLGRYRRNARVRGREWALTESEFFSLVTSPCAYCGAPPSKAVRRDGSKPLLANGLDRRDNTVGYTRNNVVPCCWDCNKAKGSRSFQEFTAWLDRLASTRAGNGVALGAGASI